MRIKIRKRIYYSILISLCIHIGFMVWSYFVKIMPSITSSEKPQRSIHVKLAKDISHGHLDPSEDTRVSQKHVSPENTAMDTKILEQAMNARETVKQNVDSSVQKKNKPVVSSTTQQMEVLEKPQMDDLVMTKKVRRAVRKNLIDLGDTPDENFASGSPVLDSGNDISNDFLSKNNLATQFSPEPPTRVSNGPNDFQVMRKGVAGYGKKLNVQSSGAALSYELSRFQDAKSGQKFFKLLVKVRDATVNYPVIPKELVFLLDASESIGAGRLDQFVQGLIYSLKNLNGNDRFNIIVFKDKTIPFSPVSVKPDAANIKNAVTFLKALKSGSTTDVFNALKTSIDVNNKFTPSYRMLITDGFPTRGIVDARQVINEASKMNDGRVSIFTFGGGVSMSPYMLDFVAFKNRGFSQFADRDYYITRELNKFYDKIKDPLLLNLRYHSNGLNEKEVFPRVMPDFFKGSEFVIYGKFDKEDKFFVQVLGNVLGETKEFTITDALQSASPGTKEIMRNWAFHKVYYLISELKYKEDNQALIDQIVKLCEEYQIETPYSKGLRQQIPAKKQNPVPVAAPAKAVTQPKNNFSKDSVSTKK